MPRLGELLCERELVTAAQVEEAVQHQVLYGGRLGTNLVELNRVSVDELAQALAQQHNTPLPAYAWLENPDPAAVRKVSRPLVEKHRFVPLRLEGRLLHLAVMDPHDPMMLDELRFATGCRLKAYVLPEVLMHDWLEWLFRVPRAIRHVDTSKTPERAGDATAGDADNSQATAPTSQAPKTRSGLDLGGWKDQKAAQGAGPERTREATRFDPTMGSSMPPSEAAAPWDEDRQTPVGEPQPEPDEQPAASDEQPAASDEQPPTASAGDDSPHGSDTTGTSEPEDKPLTGDAPANDGARDTASATAEDGLADIPNIPPAMAPSPADVAEYERQMGAAEDRETLIEQALMAASGFASYAALLVVHQGMVEGLSGCRAGFTPEPIGGVLVPTSADSEFAKAARSREPKRVQLGTNSFDARMLERLGRNPQQAAVMFPIALRGRVVNVLYADNGSDALSESGLAALQHLAMLIGESYGGLILRRKGREVSFAGDQPSPDPTAGRLPIGALTKASD